jgi:hypothetical protein
MLKTYLKSSVRHDFDSIKKFVRIATTLFVQKFVRGDTAK